MCFSFSFFVGRYRRHACPAEFEKCLASALLKVFFFGRLEVEFGCCWGRS